MSETNCSKLHLLCASLNSLLRTFSYSPLQASSEKICNVSGFKVLKLIFSSFVSAEH